jgi:hypothetical protein
LKKIRVTAAEKRAKAAESARYQEKLRLEAAGKVFLTYHNDSSWAHHKLQSGTAPLSPESVDYMQVALDDRKRLADYDAKIKAQLDAEKPPANPAGGTK